jgi:hypothetical protein
MDWYKHAQNDWNIYQDKSRIAKYVEFGKITDIQYEEITGEPYVA